MRWVASELHQRIEGAAALGIAALQQGKLGSLSGRRVAVVLTGGNVDPETFERVLSGSRMST
jgi:threonine dehydratase